MNQPSLEIAEHAFSALAFTVVSVHALVHRDSLLRSSRCSTPIHRRIIGAAVAVSVLSILRVTLPLLAPRDALFAGLASSLAGHGATVAQAALIIGLLSSKIVIEAEPRAGRILVIGAHPDDIELGCGASVAKMCDAGHEVHGLVLSHGEKGGNASARRSEAQAAGRSLGLTRVRVLGYSDTRMNVQCADIASSIERMLEELRPVLVLTHSKHDLHQDHRAAHDATLIATRATTTAVLAYESPSATNDFTPNYFVDVGEYVGVKVEAVRRHRGQRGKRYTTARAVQDRLAFRGDQARVAHAEGFEVVRMLFSRPPT